MQEYKILFQHYLSEYVLKLLDAENMVSFSHIFTWYGVVQNLNSFKKFLGGRLLRKEDNMKEWGNFLDHAF